MATRSVPRYSYDEYLELDRKSEIPNEYIFGEIVPLAGATASHGRIVATTGRAIENRLMGGPCRLFSALRVPLIPRVVSAHPDWSVICGPLQFTDDEKDTVINPILCLEVLSPSTRNYDLGDKARMYCRLPSLRHLVLIEQNCVGVEHWRRLPADHWEVEHFRDVNDTVRLESLNIELPLAEVYSGVEWSESK
jgi:Uma2 family endonuclease